HGVTEGPTMWLTGAIHGDEIVGVEIIRRVLNTADPTKMAGTVLACPVVNVPGFANSERYFPDRRDLNRSFPGSNRGSLASRFARVLMDQVIRRGDVGIDFHTGSDHRANHPQIRADLSDQSTSDLAHAFGAPLSIHARVRDGSLREAAVNAGVTTLLYEGGGASRFDSQAVEVGTAGVLRVMQRIGQLQPGDQSTSEPPETTVVRRSHWVRSPRSGIARVEVELGQHLVPRQPVATVTDAYGSWEWTIRARSHAVVIGRNERPVVHQGDALVHLGTPVDQTQDG
ncbi:MAG: succinylglutamate desuccinylase/aspartoacylase family protein, partial [Acidimicrobiales bacterium]|nr:succinylglutamate desuccinylase/aspartoacylase family protein [Acidimicrobiales bacterium]